jgi:hypothetical protein
MKTWVDMAGAASRIRLCAVAAAALLVTVLACTAPALAQPVWRVDAMADTTAPQNGSIAYLTQLNNVGDVATDGVTPFTLIANLPGHVTATDVELPFTSGGSPVPASADGWNCTAGDGVSSLVGASVVQCVLDPASSFMPPLSPFEMGFASYNLPVIDAAVDGTASGTLTATFQISGGGASNVGTTVAPVRISQTPPGFGISAFDGQVTADDAGDPYTQAGGHPYEASFSFDFNTITNPDPNKGVLWPVEATKDIITDLPPGFIGNPTIVPRCSASDLATSNGVSGQPLCPPESQVGTTLIRTNGIGTADVLGPIPIFNVVPPPGVPARFGFNFDGTVVTLDAHVRSNDYAFSVSSSDVQEALAISGTTVTFWGVPGDPSHDRERACPGDLPPGLGGISCAVTGVPLKAFLRNPTACTPPGQGLESDLRIDSWQHPGVFESATFFSHLPPAYPFPPISDSPPLAWGAQQGPTDCEKVPFDPTFSASLAAPVQAGSPSGFSFDLKLPQSDDPNQVGEGDLKKAVVKLPVGVSLSPASADGLASCSPAQIGLGSDDDPTCPDSSKVGTVSISTPLLDTPLTGSVYLATPQDNPFHSLVAIYLVAKGPGVVIKLPGRVDLDPSTGQVTTTFDNNPQVPFSDLTLDFKSGPRAPLVAPAQCGSYTTTATFTSWSGKSVTEDSTFDVTQGHDGTPCAAPGFDPSMTAGTLDPVAGADTTLLATFSRPDGDQQLGSVSIDTPTGLLGRIASAVLCPDGPASAGTCTDGSRVGSVAVGAGAGSNPFFITAGRVYITGPYKGTPFGLSIVVPAIAGPFDLGTVVVRQAIFIDRHNAHLKVVSDPLPTMLQGIPLDVREIRVAIDRPHFIINPTSCAEKHVLGMLTSTAGTVAHLANRFQVTNCASLAFTPRIALTVGATHRTRAGVSTPLTTTITQSGGEANLRSVTVTLPTTLNARLGVLSRACSLAAFDAGTCGAGARVGTAVAVTPLLRDPLRGSAWFVKNPRRTLPDLMIALRGQVAIDLTGKVGVNPRTNQLTTRFDTIPDTPITKFTLRLVAGANGPLGTVMNLCGATARRATAGIGMRGQNGALLQLDQRLRIHGCPRGATR